MPIVGAIAVPHPPLIVPAVGRGEEKKRYVLNLIDKYLLERGIAIDSNIIMSYIEAEVYKMNLYTPKAEQFQLEVPNGEVPATIQE